MRTVYLRLLLDIIAYFGLTKVRNTSEVAQNKLGFLLVFMQSFQLKRENDTETTDNEESNGQHIEHSDSSEARLPNDSHGTQNGQNAEDQIPAPVFGAIAFQVGGVTAKGESSEHEPECDDKRNQFHAYQRIEYQVDTYQQVNDTACQIPSPTVDNLLVADGKEDFEDTADQN